ncbi:LysM peptidoglycan-binding domain-containing protein [Thiopseudomonas alkaliphila]|uniref:LysM peptidoglycan-binding domain-containing protein n=1 Tax=Thiopseudomonas alkaliphila TaxID=1697053 RepID=A0AAW7DUN9_9GAMM|nr:LysM peptidoglycan-binding domain-containing protein [Thiopseudomonas alkaliphila]MDM1696933.1 LysM peptidoglycan-binding domain-containing protein [Thiopseudomonas alkaliphila]
MRKTLLALLLCTVGGFAQADLQLKEGHPQSYTVVQGDTLWDISGKFLRQPWKWPKIWQANPQVANPHLIYPGDTLTLDYVNGQPRVTLNRGQSRGTIKLSPQIRSTPIAQAIPTIPLESINSFLIGNMIIDSRAEFDSAPYVLTGNAERVIAGTGDTIFVRGNDLEEGQVYGIYREGKVYTDGTNKNVLGINANEIGSGELIALEEGVGTLKLSRVNQEVRITDRLFINEERAINSTFMPNEPQFEISGSIIDVPRGLTQVGQYDVITIDRGLNDSLEVGDVLAIYKAGETVRDRVTNRNVKVPDERAGLAMVFRTYDQVSYAIVLYATRQLALSDRVANP